MTDSVALELDIGVLFYQNNIQKISRIYYLEIPQ